MENKSILGWSFGFLTSLLGAGWAVFTYVVPDPSVLGMEAINWKNVLLFTSSLVAISWVVVYFFLQKLPSVIRHLSILILYSVTAFSFFWVGTKYQDPLFGSSEQEAVYAYNDSTTILGKRIETIENISIQLRGCQKVMGKIACKLDLLNNNTDRDVSFSGDTRAFDDVSNEMELDSLVIGSSNVSTYKTFALPKGVKTTVMIAFKLTNENSQKLTSLRVKLSGLNGVRKGVKFDGVPLV